MVGYCPIGVKPSANSPVPEGAGLHLHGNGPRGQLQKGCSLLFYSQNYEQRRDKISKWEKPVDIQGHPWDRGGRSPMTEYPVQTPRSRRHERGSRAMSVPMTPSSSCMVLILVTCIAVTLCEHSLQPAPHHVGPINNTGLLLCNLCYHDMAPPRHMLVGRRE